MSDLIDPHDADHHLLHHSSHKNIAIVLSFEISITTLEAQLLTAYFFAFRIYLVYTYAITPLDDYQRNDRCELQKTKIPKTRHFRWKFVFPCLA